MCDFGSSTVLADCLVPLIAGAKISTDSDDQGPLLLTWFNLNPSLDK